MILRQESLRQHRLWAGAFLLCLGASLRFGDSQHIKWSSVIMDGECIRGSCYRTKTGVGVAWVCTLSFASSHPKMPHASWVAHWLVLMGTVWQELREAFGQSTEPDCLLFTWDGQAFTPLSFAQCTKALRAFLSAYGMQDSRMHSFKATMLSWMNQLLLGDRARAEQGRHKHKDSIELYGRDDIWHSLGAQQQGSESGWGGGLISLHFQSRMCHCTFKPLLWRHPSTHAFRCRQARRPTSSGGGYGVGYHTICFPVELFTQAGAFAW